MKFLAALILGIVMMGVIAAGLTLAVLGKPWLLVLSLLAFVVGVGKIGCAVH